jgi:hypothetical protein
LKQTLVFLSLAMLMFGVVACTPNKPMPDELMVVREAAWNSLEDLHKKQVDGDWKNAKVEHSKWQEMPIPKGGGEIVKADNVYKVTFDTKHDARLSSIKVFFDADTNEHLESSMTNRLNGDR